MSSVSSFEGSEKDSFFQRNIIDGPSSFRHSYLRKTDFLDTLDSSRSRDTDTWSVAATIDDQESVISTHGGPPSIISSSRLADRETDDDRSTLDGESSIRVHLHDIHLSSIPDDCNDNDRSDNNSRIETLRDLVDNSNRILLRGNGSIDDDEDKGSRSIAAEFGDDGARSATADFDHSVVSDDEDRNNVVDDQIMAPPQPQPSFASVTKSYARLLEENEILQSQLREVQLAQKHQEEMISNLRQLTNCDDELFEKALHLSERNGGESHNALTDEDLGEMKADSPNSGNKHIKSSMHHHKSKELYFESPTIEHSQPQMTPIVNAFTLTQKLAQLAESITRFVNVTVDQGWRLTLEQALFSHITESYLSSLPFGTENQHLLNIAYADQISRFHNTLGANFAKWYRRQTVQSLSLNPATKEYLQDTRNQLTDVMLRLLNDMAPNENKHINNMHIWEDILDLCAALSLEIHGGDADVSIQSIAVGRKFNQEIMAVIGNLTSTEDKAVKMVINPLFIDEEGIVLLPARVVLE